MADVKTKTVPRSELAAVFKNPRLVRLVEDLSDDVSTTLPGKDSEQDQAIEQAQTDATAAGEAASDALTLANQVDGRVTTLQSAPFVVVSADPLIPSASVLTPGQGISVDTATPGTAVVKSSDIIARSAVDSTESAGAFAASTLAFPAEANAVYWVDGFLIFQTAATTTGIGVTLGGPSGTSLIGKWEHNVSGNQIAGSYSLNNLGVKTDTGNVFVANEDVPLCGRWLVTTSATPGNVTLYFRTEIAASTATLRTGSTLIAKRLQ